MGYLVSLTDDERIRMAKMGKKDLHFVEQALAFSKENGEYLPAYLPLGEVVWVEKDRATSPGGSAQHLLEGKVIRISIDETCLIPLNLATKLA